MRCSDFLHHYSDYRDGLIDDPTLYRALRRHLADCARCTRYDARIARGAIVLRTAHELEPSRRMREHLERRLTVPPVEAEVEPAIPGAARLMAALMLVAAVALVVWEVTAGPNRRAAQVSPALQPAASGLAIQSVSGFAGEWRAPRVTRTAAEAWGDLAP